MKMYRRLFTILTKKVHGWKPVMLDFENAVIQVPRTVFPDATDILISHFGERFSISN